MKRAGRIAAFTLVSCCCMDTFGQTSEVPPDFWDRPRTAAALISHESVKSMVTAAMTQPEAQLVIHHARGQEPLIQAEELRSWLGALAIDTRRIALRNDLGPGAPIKMELVP